MKSDTIPDVTHQETVLDEGSEGSEGIVTTTENSQDRPTPVSGWRGWWTRPKELGEDIGKSSDSAAATSDTNEATLADATKSDRISTNTVAAWNKSATETSPSVIALDDQVESTSSQNTAETAAVAPVDDQPAKSWFGMWNSGQKTASEMETTTANVSFPPTVPVALEEASISSNDVINIPVADKLPDDKELSTSQNSGAWAFWSREKRKTSIPFFDSNPITTAAGELAVEGSASQFNPESAHVKEEPEKPAPNIAKPRQKSRPVSLGNAAVSLFKGKQLEEAIPFDVSTTPPHNALPELAKQPVEAQKSAEWNQLKQLSVENLLLPAFRNTYKEDERPSYYEQLLRMIGQSAIPKPRHLFLAPVAPRIQNALAIGVHGYFPGPLIQRGKHIEL